MLTCRERERTARTAPVFMVACCAERCRPDCGSACGGACAGCCGGEWRIADCCRRFWPACLYASPPALIFFSFAIFFFVGSALMSIVAYMLNKDDPEWVDTIVSENSEAVLWGTLGSGLFFAILGLLGMLGLTCRKSGPLGCYGRCVLFVLAIAVACTVLIYLSHDYRAIAIDAHWLVRSMRDDGKGMAAAWVVDVYHGWETLYRFCAPLAVVGGAADPSSGVTEGSSVVCLDATSNLDEWINEHCPIYRPDWGEGFLRMLACREQLIGEIEQSHPAMWTFCTCPERITQELYDQSLTVRIVSPLFCAYLLLISCAVCVVTGRMAKAKKKGNRTKLLAPDDVEVGVDGAEKEPLNDAAPEPSNWGAESDATWQPIPPLSPPAKVVVAEVLAEGMAYGVVEVGDRLVAIDGAMIFDHEQATEKMRKAKGVVRLTVQRAEVQATLEVRKKTRTARLGVHAVNICDWEEPGAFGQAPPTDGPGQADHLAEPSCCGYNEPSGGYGLGEQSGAYPAPYSEPSPSSCHWGVVPESSCGRQRQPTESGLGGGWGGEQSQSSPYGAPAHGGWGGGGALPSSGPSYNALPTPPPPPPDSPFFTQRHGQAQPPQGAPPLPPSFSASSFYKHAEGPHL